MDWSLLRSMEYRNLSFDISVIQETVGPSTIIVKLSPFVLVYVVNSRPHPISPHFAHFYLTITTKSDRVFFIGRQLV